MEDSIMNKNLKLAVFTVFTILAILASGMVLFVMGQEPAPKQKKYQKTITMKITKDENGNIISSDTTFTFESPDLSGEDPMILHFDSEAFEKSMKEFEKNFEHFNFQWIDSANADFFKPCPPNMLFLDSIDKNAMQWNLQWSDQIESIERQGDEMQKQIEIQLRCHDSLLKEHDQFQFKTDSACPHFFFHNGFGWDGSDEKDVRVYKYIEPDKQHKVIIIDKDGSEIADESKVKVWKTEDGKAIIIKTKTSFAEIAETSKSELEDAGIKAPKKELEVEDLMISPNPGDGKFTLSFRVKEPKPITIRIYDQNGNVVYEEKIKDFYGYYSKEIDLTDKPQGTFFIQILQGIYSVIKKLMII